MGLFSHCVGDYIRIHADFDVCRSHWLLRVDDVEMRNEALEPIRRWGIEAKIRHLRIGS